MAMSTKQFRKRNAIMAYLKSTKAHPSAETVYGHLKEEFPDLSLGTVYRNLSMFKQQGMIASLGTVNGIERFDANTVPHVHFICTGCDAVMDLPHIHTPEALRQAAADESGGRVQECHLSFTGLCRECKG
mgnify:CR=1 FL=1